MNNPLHAAYYADNCIADTVTVLQRRQLARDTHLVRLECPEIAAQITPGQFIMVRIPDSAEPLLGRAFALYDVIHDKRSTAACIDIVFFVIGKITRRLASVGVGERLEIWGPLGNGFVPTTAEHLIMVAGGIGQTPFLALAKECLGVQAYGIPGRQVQQSKRVSLCYGVRSADLLTGITDFREYGVDVRIATDDGSAGRHGLVSELLADVLTDSENSKRVVCCGPEPMMATIATLCAKHQVACEVSLETPMACGMGICFSCVTQVRDDSGQWDYQRTCVDGPVFDATKIVW